jgi:hypothetical protein
MQTQNGQHTPPRRWVTRTIRSITVSAALAVGATGLLVAAGATPAVAGTGGRYTFLRDDGGYWGITFAGAGYGEQPFAIDTNGDRKQELAVYYNGRFTIRRDDGSYWGVTIPGGGFGEIPVAADTNGDGRQELGVYYRGRFTFMRADNSLWGVTFPGAGREEMPLAVDTNGDGVQELAVYRAGRFTFMRADGSLWGETFAGTGANELPFVIDTDGDRRQELAVYKTGRMTIRRDNGTYWGFDYLGAGLDEFPLAVDTDGNGRQEFTVYNHVTPQTRAKQILANAAIDRNGRVVQEDLEQTADGQPAHGNDRMSSVILRVIVRLADGHRLRIEALTGNGTGHSANSRHYTGDGVDISSIDGSPLTGRDAKSVMAINLVKGDLVTGSRIGQVNCAQTSPSLPAGVTYISDTCNHLHIDTPSNVD